MKVEGRFQVNAPREAVFGCITDCALMAGCIPGCESIEQVSAREYRARVAVGVGSIQARFDLVVEVTGEQAPEWVTSRTRGDEGSRASMLSADSRLALAALGPDSTEVSYASEVAVTGRLGKFALGVMKKKVESLGAEFADRFRAAIAARLASEAKA